MRKDNIVLYGASGHGKVIADILESKGISNIIFWDDQVQTEFIYPVILPKPEENNFMCIISIGNNQTRKAIAKTLNGQFINAIHPDAVVSRNALIESGTVVMAGVVINPGVHIGMHCIINTSASVDHDCKLEHFVHVSPGAHLAGGVHVGEGTLIGMGSNIIQGITIGKWATIGAGSVILHNVPDYAVVVGVPGKIIHYHSMLTAIE